MREAESNKRARTSTSKYRCTNHVSPTTNVVERANSQSKLIMTDMRSSLHPDTLNMLMILKHNKSYWPTAESIQEVLDSPDFREPEPEPEADSEEDA